MTLAGLISAGLPQSDNPVPVLLHDGSGPLREKTWLVRARHQPKGLFPGNGVVEPLSVSGSNLKTERSRSMRPRLRYHEAQDAAVLSLISALVVARPIGGSEPRAVKVSA